MSKLAWAIISVFILTFVTDLYISFNIVSACVNGLGENGCIGVSGLAYLLLAPPYLLLIILVIAYIVVNYKGLNFGKLVLYILLANAILYAPMAFANSVSRAYLFDTTFLFFDFTKVNYRAYEDQNIVTKLSDCEVFMHGADNCKTNFIIKNNLGINACDDLKSDYKYQCRYDVMKNDNYAGISLNYCTQNFYDTKSLPNYYHYQHCVAKVASLERNNSICEVLKNIGNPQNLDNFRNFYAEGCYRDISESNF